MLADSPRIDAQRATSPVHGFRVGAGLVTAKQEEWRKFGNILSSIICDGSRQRRINQAF
jgi:hypothetical protein